MSGTRHDGRAVERLEPRTHLSVDLLTAGDLDPAFGSGGRVVVDVGSRNDAAVDMLALPGGKTLILSRHFPDASNGTFDTLIRLNADGIRDTTFGQGGAGLFVAPTVLEKEVMRQFGVVVVGRLDAVRERFYAITVERRLKHPAVIAISEAANEMLMPKRGR